jgi:dTMP kinase
MINFQAPSRQSMKSNLFVFEGPDGVGKTRLASQLNDHLNQHGCSSELLSFPGREVGTLGEHIYRLYHNPGSFGIGGISVTSEQILFTAAHADVIENRILPALSKGTSVVLDRYWWSTWVYGTTANLNSKIRDLLISLELAIWRDVKPSCIFLVRRKQPSASEHTPENWETLVSLYDDIRLQQADQVRIVDIDNSGDLQDSFRVVLNAVQT